ncbi:MAG: hypothetical protein ACPL6F_01725, partial [Anaerolineales bacterium]
NESQKQHMRDLAYICNFRATSELPHWLSTEQRNSLKEFLTVNPHIRNLGNYTYMINSRLVDFSSVIELPPTMRGIKDAARRIFCWLANHTWALKLIFWQTKRAAENERQKALAYYQNKE